MMHCVYPLCNKGPGSGSDVIFFRVPTDKTLKKKWIQAIPQIPETDSLQIKGRVFLCSEHFGSDSFETVNGFKRLKSSAVPSIFAVRGTGFTQLDEGVDDNEIDFAMEVENTVGEESEGHSSQVKLNIHQPKPFLIHKVRLEEVRLRMTKSRYEKLEKKLKMLQSLDEGDETNIPKDIEDLIAKKKLRTEDSSSGKQSKKRPKNIEEILLYLRKELLLSESALEVLHSLFVDVPLEQPLSEDSEGLRCFAQYLVFYSTEAYEKIIEIFQVPLPSLEAIRTWFNSDRGEPGWSYDAFSVLKEKAKKIKASNKLICSLLVEEQKLAPNEEWDGKKWRGHLDYGPQMLTHSAPESDCTPQARSALCFMVTPLDRNESWRVPIAYFIVSNLSGHELSNVIHESLFRLHAIGTIILSLIISPFCLSQDGLEYLGIQFQQLPYLCPYFAHPVDPLLRVHIVYDSCTLLEMFRNFWFNSKVFVDGNGRYIDWCYVSELMKVQEAQANSAECRGEPLWRWDSSTMKSRLVAQLFSESVACTLEYYRTELNMTQFQGCDATIDFIRSMSKVFDLLNSKDNSKKSEVWRSFTVEALDFISHLKDRNGVKLHSKPHSVPILALYMTLMSVQSLSVQVPYLSTSSLSLDQIHVLFYSIRSHIGWKCQPTARQFVSAFQKHIIENNYLSACSHIKANNFWWYDVVDVSVARKEGRLITESSLLLPNTLPNCSTPVMFEHIFPITEFVALEAYHFMAISVVKAVGRLLHCDACILALQEPFTSDSPLLLLLRKTCGGTVYPSRDVLIVCASAERHLKTALRTASVETKLDVFEWRDERFASEICISVLDDVIQRSASVFSSLNQHVLKCAPDANHVYRLVRAIARCYVGMRIRGMKSWCPL